MTDQYRRSFLKGTAMAGLLAGPYGAGVASGATTEVADSGAPNLEVTWKRTVSDLAFTSIHDAVATDDGGFIAVGTTYEVNEDSQLLVQRYAADGSTRWSRRLSGLTDAWASSIVEGVDGGYVVAGGHGTDDAGLLANIDESGTLQWHRSINESDTDGLLDLEAVGTAGYIGVGYTRSGEGEAYNAWLVVFNATGEVVFQRTLGGESYDWFLDGVITDDEGFVTTGINLTAGDIEGWLVKFDKSGQVAWERTYDQSGDDDLSLGLAGTADGGFAIGGSVGDADPTDCWVLKTDERGHRQWATTWSLGENDAVNELYQTDNGGFLATGSVATEGEDYSGAFVATLDDGANPTWSRSFDADGGVRLDSLTPLSDGGYLALGYRDDTPDSSYRKGLLLKLESPNRPPEVSNATVSNDSPVVAERVTLTAQATDPEGGSVTYRWDTDGDGDPEHEGRQVSTAFDDPGERTVQLFVSDERGNRTTEEIPVDVRADFDPTVHGFGFSNWQRGDLDGHDHAVPDEDDVRDRLEDRWPDRVHEYLDASFEAVPDETKTALARLVRTGLAQGTITDGHTFGMALAAAQYHRAPDDIPAVPSTVASGPALSASEIGTPTDDGEPVGAVVDRFQRDFGSSFTGVLTTFGVMAAPENYLDDRGVAAVARDQYRAFGRVLLAVGTDEDDDNAWQFVLGYDLSETADGVELSVYDPNATAADHQGDPHSVRITGDGVSASLATDRDHGRALVLADTATVADQLDAEVAELFGVQDGLTSFYTMSPVTMTAETEDGDVVPTLGVDNGSTEPTDVDGMGFAFGEPADSYEVTLEGTADGEYTLEALVIDDDEALLEESADGTASDGKTITYTADTTEGTLVKTATSGGGLLGQVSLPVLAGGAAGLAALAGGVYGGVRLVRGRGGAADDESRGAPSGPPAGGRSRSTREQEPPQGSPPREAMDRRDDGPGRRDGRPTGSGPRETGTGHQPPTDHGLGGPDDRSTGAPDRQPQGEAGRQPGKGSAGDGPTGVSYGPGREETAGDASSPREPDQGEPAAGDGDQGSGDEGSAPGADTIFCPACGEEMPAEASFCRYCGNSL